MTKGRFMSPSRSTTTFCHILNYYIMTPSSNVCRYTMIDVFYKMHHHCTLNYYTKLKTLLFWHLWMWNSFMSRITYDYRSISFMQGKHKLKLSLHTRIWVQETITYQYKFIKNCKHHYEIQNLTKTSLSNVTQDIATFCHRVI